MPTFLLFIINTTRLPVVKGLINFAKIVRSQVRIPGRATVLLSYDKNREIFENTKSQLCYLYNPWEFGKLKKNLCNQCVCVCMWESVFLRVITRHI